MEFFDTPTGKAFGIGMLAVLSVILSSIVVYLVALVDLGVVFALLMVTYPLISIMIGVASAFAGLKIWFPAALTVVLFGGTALLIFNYTALGYVPVYLLVSLAGYGVTAGIRWFFTRGQVTQ